MADIGSGQDASPKMQHRDAETTEVTEKSGMQKGLQARTVWLWWVRTRPYALRPIHLRTTAQSRSHCAKNVWLKP